jgi:hypothetical protein
MSNTVIKYGLMAAVLGGVYLYSSNNSSPSFVEEEIDLNLALDITVDTLHSYSDSLGDQKPEGDAAFLGFAETLGTNYNLAQPPLYKEQIGVSPEADASLMAFSDTNMNRTWEDGEAILFKIEIDGEQSRIIASSNSGAVNEHHFSGTSLLAGYLIGSMMSRQRGAGVTSKQLASKKPISSQAAARTRAGSGSHSTGK